VCEAPESADEEFGVPRVEGVSYTLYADQSVMKDAFGEDRHISFSAAPLYDDGEFVGVVEMIWDRTGDALRQQQLQGLVDALREIVEAVERTAEGIEQVSDATDDQAATTEEIASMLDEAVDMADDVCDEVQAVASANEEQAAQVDEIDDAVNRLGG